MVIEYTTVEWNKSIYKLPNVQTTCKLNEDIKYLYYLVSGDTNYKMIGSLKQFYTKPVFNNLYNSSGDNHIKIDSSIVSIVSESQTCYNIMSSLCSSGVADEIWTGPYTDPSYNSGWICSIRDNSASKIYHDPYISNEKTKTGICEKFQKKTTYTINYNCSGLCSPSPAPAKPTPAPAKPTPAPAKPTPAPAKPTPAPAKPTPEPPKPSPAPEAIDFSLINILKTLTYIGDWTNLNKSTAVDGIIPNSTLGPYEWLSNNVSGDVRYCTNSPDDQSCNCSAPSCSKGPGQPTICPTLPKNEQIVCPSPLCSPSCRITENNPYADLSNPFLAQCLSSELHLKFIYPSFSTINFASGSVPAPAPPAPSSSVKNNDPGIFTGYNYGGWGWSYSNRCPDPSDSNNTLYMCDQSTCGGPCSTPWSIVDTPANPTSDDGQAYNLISYDIEGLTAMSGWTGDPRPAPSVVENILTQSRYSLRNTTYKSNPSINPVWGIKPSVDISGTTLAKRIKNNYNNNSNTHYMITTLGANELKITPQSLGIYDQSRLHLQLMWYSQSFDSPWSYPSADDISGISLDFSNVHIGVSLPSVYLLKKYKILHPENILKYQLYNILSAAQAKFKNNLKGLWFWGRSD